MKFLAAAAFSLIATGAFAAPAEVGSTSLGDVLTDDAGMTLYIFTNDSEGTSVCNDGCAAKWPPFFASDGAADDGDYTVIARADGTQQWAYKGQPLYYWMNDQASGDTTGEGVGGVWFVARP